MIPDDEEYWYAPKRGGYGSVLPIAWQGWALIAGYAIALILATPLIFYSIGIYVVVAGALTAAMLVISARKTRGGWHWRSGGRK